VPRLILIALVATLLAIGCGDEEVSTTTSTTTRSATTTSTFTTTTTVEGNTAGDGAGGNTGSGGSASADGDSGGGGGGNAAAGAGGGGGDEGGGGGSPYSGTLQDAYEAARINCADFGVKAVAKEFGSPPTPEAAAAAYGEALSTGEHIQASTDGCLAGFGG
jgi:hypothetical protein